jgi:hypothetical protein
MPLSLTRILCSLSYPIIEIVAACLAGLVGRLVSNDYDFPGFVDFHSRNTHTRSGYGLEGSGHVLLPECGRRASHGIYLISIARQSSSW